MKNENIRDVFWGSSENHFPYYLFENGNKVFYTKNLDSTFSFKSFNIGMIDFEKEPYPLYEPVNDFTSIHYLLGGSAFLLIAAGIFLYLKPKKTHHVTGDEPEKTLSYPEEDELKFNTIELALIQKLMDASKSNRQFSVEDINIALGLGRKSLEIQKKGRTETINRINHKFKVIYNSSNDLIERVRLKEDKRFYNYVINNENAQKIREKM